jgi:hypothetical protein
VEVTDAERESYARTMECLVSGMRRYAEDMGRDLTADEQRRIEEMERPLEAGRTRARLNREELIATLEGGRQRNASRESD